MVGRTIAMLDEVTLAAPAYIARHGMPEHPDALDEHQMVGFRSSATGGVLPLEFTMAGAVREITLPATVTVNAAESYIAAGGLVLLLDDFPPSSTPVSLLYPRNRQLSPRVRVFIDWVAAIFEDGH